MSTALDYYAAEFTRLWSKLTVGPPFRRKSLTLSPTSAAFSLCTCKWGNFALVESVEQSHLREFRVRQFYLSPKIRVRQGLSVLIYIHLPSYFTYTFYKCYNPHFLIVGYFYLKNSENFQFYFQFSFPFSFQFSFQFSFHKWYLEIIMYIWRKGKFSKQ